MKDDVWHPYLLDGRRIEVRESAGCWYVRVEGREAEDPHLDHALAQLLGVPSHVAVRLALGVLRHEPGSDISS